MSVNEYAQDISEVLSHRYDNGGDYWTTPDKRLIKGAPFSTLESVSLLLELGMSPSDPVLEEAAKLIFSTFREDGRFQLAPKSAIYPCHTVNVANVLCQLGFSKDERVQQTLQHLLDSRYTDGGWRCNKFSFGRGEETNYSNPGTTLMGLSAFRQTDYLNNEISLNQAVEFLLEHWQIKRPIGPCHYGIGTLFMQPEYPFRTYNLFYYVYVLSFYEYAKEDKRFLEALAALEETMENGQIIVARRSNRLAKLSICKKGQPSSLATKRYQEILRNLNRN